jgi:hypothetical protein
MSLHDVKERKSGRTMRKPLTSKDREHYVHKLRAREGRIAWTVNKSRFGQNDILGCIDTISYTPWDIYMDQTSTVNHISHKRAEIRRMLINAPETVGVSIFVHGIDGYREKRDNVWVPVITRHVMEQWIDDDDWERTEMPVPELASEGSVEMKGNGRATMNPPEPRQPKTNSKRTHYKIEKVKE